MRIQFIASNGAKHTCSGMPCAVPFDGQNRCPNSCRLFHAWFFSIITSKRPPPPYPATALQRGCESELVGETHRHLGVLQDVVEVDFVKRVGIRVDVGARVLKGGLDYKGRRVAGARCRGMIRARIATLGLDVGNVTVLGRARLVVGHMSTDSGEGLLTATMIFLMKLVKPVSTKSVMTPTAASVPGLT